MKQARNFLMLLTLAAVFAQGCDSGAECDPCSDDGDCDPELTCEQFQVPGGDSHLLCATPSTLSCVVYESYFADEDYSKDMDRARVDMSEQTAERQTMQPKLHSPK